MAKPPIPRKRLADLIGASPTFQVVDGVTFVKVRDAAKIATLHPGVLEMSREMLVNVGGKGMAYPLSTHLDKMNRQDIARLLKAQLAKVAKVLAPTRRLRTHVVQDPSGTPRIVCWYSEAK